MEETEGKLMLIMDNLTPAMIEKARTELGETEEVRANALEKFRRLIKNEKNFEVPLDDVFLLRYLRARKFHVGNAFKLLRKYWKFRKNYRKIYDTTDAERVNELFLRNFLGLSFFRDKNGCAIIFFKMALWNPEIDPFDEMFQSVSGLLVYASRFPATQVCGYRTIIDFRGASWTQIKMCTPSNLMLIVYSTQFCFPGRFKGIHIISGSKLFPLVQRIVNPVLTFKLKSRITFLDSDLQSLQEHIHPSVLPNEYGGTAGPFSNDAWSEILLEVCKSTVEELKYGYKD